MSSAVVGLGACGLSSVFFGSAYVPIKKFDAGNGLFVQWVMATAILCVGLAVNAIEEFPVFQPLAMLGGLFWALGNVTAIPILSSLGLGMGMLIWGATNCITGWAAGRFGLFGIHATVPAYPVLNYLGLLMVIVGGVCFSQIRPTVRTPSNTRLVTDIPSNEDQAVEDSPLISPTTPSALTRRTKRMLAIFTALVAGVFYGVTFVPVIYIQDHPEEYPGASRNGLHYVFSHYCGIFLTATLLLIGYIIYTKNNPVVNPRILFPSQVAGAMWAIAQSSWFVANDNLSQSVTFPIISMVPGVIAAMWSVFYFKEIAGKRNLNILVVAISTTLIGACLVGVSK